MTQTAAVFGSPAYMSPEQMRSTKLVDARTDLWSLGIILYECVSGTVPYHADTFTELCLRVSMDPLPPLPRTTGLSAGLEKVIYKCLEKDPVRRYQGVAELAAALAPFASPAAQTLAEGIQGIPLAATGEGWTDVSKMTAQQRGRKSKSKTPLIIAGAVLAAGAAVGIAIATSGSQKAAVVPDAPAARVAVTPPDARPVVAAPIPDARPAPDAPPRPAPPDAAPPPRPEPKKPRPRPHPGQPPGADPLANPE
jgi:serine/threonine-protein kinase